ncbi:MAG: DUF1648 domain-containing protein [Acidobacteriota bacterium]
MTKTRIFLVVAVAAFVVQMMYIYPNLPATVASHFDAAGNPNGWMTKGVFLIIEIGLIVLVVGEFLLVPRFVRRLPPSLVNMPNKEYWLAPEHIDETMEIFRSYFEVFGGVIVALFVVVNQFVYAANTARSNLPGSIWMVIVAFLLFTVVWVIKFIGEFRLK